MIQPNDMARIVETVGIGFFFAPSHHPAMRHVMGVRQEIGCRTVFNILGPLTNPAHALAQVIGVYDGRLTEVMAQVLKELGTVRAFVVHGEDGLDEISNTCESRISELRRNEVRTYMVRPEDFGLTRARMTDLQGGSAADNAEIIRRLLKGERGPKRDIVVLNAGAAIAAGGKAEDIAAGIATAQHSIESGAALDKLNRLVEFCQN
jgi:anthranilate phosphoribosyltransferase